MVKLITKYFGPLPEENYLVLRCPESKTLDVTASLSGAIAPSGLFEVRTGRLRIREEREMAILPGVVFAPLDVSIPEEVPASPMKNSLGYMVVRATELQAFFDQIQCLYAPRDEVVHDDPPPLFEVDDRVRVVKGTIFEDHHGVITEVYPNLVTLELKIEENSAVWTRLIKINPILLVKESV